MLNNNQATLIIGFESTNKPSAWPRPTRASFQMRLEQVLEPSHSSPSLCRRGSSLVVELRLPPPPRAQLQQAQPDDDDDQPTLSQIGQELRLISERFAQHRRRKQQQQQQPPACWSVWLRQLCAWLLGLDLE